MQSRASNMLVAVGVMRASTKRVSLKGAPRGPQNEGPFGGLLNEGPY